MKSPITPKIQSFEDADRSRRVTEDCIGELQGLPGSGIRVLKDISLADSVATPIAHKLGRPAQWVQASCVRGALNAGRIEETRSSSHNRQQVVVLTATGFGATVVVDVLVL